MFSVDLRKMYLFSSLEPAPDSKHLPAAGDIYYECLDCTMVLSSAPHIKCHCNCGNLTGGAGKTKVAHPERVRIVKGKLKSAHGAGSLLPRKEPCLSIRTLIKTAT